MSAFSRVLDMLARRLRPDILTSETGAGTGPALARAERDQEAG